MRAVERVPRAAAPAAERDAVRSQRRAAASLMNQSRMLLEHAPTSLRRRTAPPRSPARSRGAGSGRAPSGRCRRTPRRCRASRPSRSDTRRRSARSLRPGTLLRDDVEVVEHLLRRDARTEAVPRAPAGRRPCGGHAAADGASASRSPTCAQQARPDRRRSRPISSSSGQVSPGAERQAFAYRARRATACSCPRWQASRPALRKRRCTTKRPLNRAHDVNAKTLRPCAGRRQRQQSVDTRACRLPPGCDSASRRCTGCKSTAIGRRVPPVCVSI